MLQGLNVFFTKYPSFIAALWLIWVLTDVVFGLLVFPGTREGIWYIGLGGTLGCLVAVLVVWVLKALFHKKVSEALAAQRGPDA